MAPRLPAPRRRRQLLDVAIECFAARGFHGTSMDDVALAAGVTKPVLYQHFGSKRDLYLQILEDVGSQLMEAIAKATAAAGGPHEQVEAGFAAYVGFLQERPQAFPLLFGGGAKRDAEFAEAVSRVEDSIARFIAVLIAADVADEHRQVMAYAVVGMAEGVLRHWYDQRPGIPPETLVRQMADLAWAGLRGVRRV
ncbi:MAG TPA: TetR/AcrR family transcriptional regulator [Acidimicrobiales bacterium]|nr:TetR/AcrR family transcriptional regulator [Acidimicrobiales bacterium]